uniref:Uncharacterized protein n=1 Tax=Arundo donax TaxID=35708 RepID=A0A0A9DX38_ARUDO
MVFRPGVATSSMVTVVMTWRKDQINQHSNRTILKLGCMAEQLIS